jgi:hypothetical protein
LALNKMAKPGKKGKKVSLATSMHPKRRKKLRW